MRTNLDRTVQVKGLGYYVRNLFSHFNFDYLRVFTCALQHHPLQCTVWEMVRIASECGPAVLANKNALGANGSCSQPGDGKQAVETIG